jgi:hypothetical protein
MKRYFIDLDNTLCNTVNGEYRNSTPIQERIAFINDLKSAGNHITIWTARGSKSKIDYTELTCRQLEEWGVQYDELLLGKPDYDVYLDDKSFHIDSVFPVPSSSQPDATKKQTSEIVEKGWGKEIIFANNSEYCGKILCFENNEEVYRPIESLQKGDLVKTIYNGYIPVYMIGTTSLYNPGNNYRITNHRTHSNSLAKYIR